MPTLDITTGDIPAFWEWLRKEQPDDHKLFELWVFLEAGANYTSRMGRKELLFTQAWVTDVLMRARSKSRIGRLSTLSAENEEAIEGGERTSDGRVTARVREELVRMLEEALLPSHRAWLRGRAAQGEAEARAAALGRARAKLGPARRRQKELLATAKEGCFWHTSRAPDGEPYTVLTTSRAARPAPSLVALGRAPEDAKGVDPAKIATGSWYWLEGKLWVAFAQGATAPVAGIGRSLGVPAVVGKPDEAAPVVADQQRHLERLVKLNGAEGRGDRGWFWFFRKGGIDEIVVNKARGAELDAYLGDDLLARGLWVRDDDAAVVSLRLEGAAAGDRPVAERLAKLVRSRKIFRWHRVVPLAVTVVGRGFTLAEPVRVEAKAPEGPDPAYTRRVRHVTDANRRLALEAEGNFWFTQFGRDGAPLLVLYLERNPSFAKRELLTEDAAKAGFTVGGTWKRDTAKRTVTVKLLGTAPSTMKRTLERYFAGANPFKEPRVLLA